MNVRKRMRGRERMEEIESYSCDGLSYYLVYADTQPLKKLIYFLLSNTERFANGFIVCERKE